MSFLTLSLRFADRNVSPHFLMCVYQERDKNAAILTDLIISATRESWGALTLPHAARFLGVEVPFRPPMVRVFSCVFSEKIFRIH